MGEILTVWSPFKKTGKTLMLYYITEFLLKSVEKPFSCLTVDLDCQYGNLLELYGLGKQTIGLEDLVNIHLTPNLNFDVHDMLAKVGDHYIIGSSRLSSMYINRNLQVYEKLFQKFKDQFDLILFDTVSGDENPLTNMVLGISSNIICVMEQDQDLLDRFMVKPNNNLACVINHYDETVYPNSKEIMSYCSLKNIFTLPRCGMLRTMKNKKLLSLYGESDTEYLRSIHELGSFICKTFQLNEKQLLPEKKKKGLFGRVCFQ